MRAAGCLNGNLGQAVRALLGGRCGGCFFVLAERSGLVHELDESKQHDCHDEKVDDRRDEGTILDVHATKIRNIWYKYRTIFGKHCQLYLCKKRKNGCPHRASVTSH